MVHASTAPSRSHGAKVRNREPREFPKSEMFQDFLVYQDDSAGTRNALEYAAALSECADGNLVALMLYMVNFYPIGMYGEASADAWLIAQRAAEKEAGDLENRLRERLAKIAPDADLRRSDLIAGNKPATLAEFSRYADVLVLGWDAQASEGKDEQRQLFNAALFHSGRPVIVVPESFRRHGLPRKIILAWSPTKEATRALHDALPLLRSAEEVRIIVVDDQRTFIEKDAPGIDIAKHLARHDIHADVKHVPKGSHGATRTLLDEAQYFGAELLVLGGYGHSRITEWVLGGVTREMLKESAIPMFFSH